MDFAQDGSDLCEDQDIKSIISHYFSNAEYNKSGNCII